MVWVGKSSHYSMLGVRYGNEERVKVALFLQELHNFVLTFAHAADVSPKAGVGSSA